MGAVISYFRELYVGISGLLEGVSEHKALFEALKKRIASPQLPVSNPTVSFWQQNPVFQELVNIQSENLPSHADIVIIGSGMSGASIAHTLLNECRAMGLKRKVVVLEGRTVCSGATGRNGGHIKTTFFLEYVKNKERFSSESAKKIAKFHMMHLPFLLRLVEAENHAIGEAREVEATDAFTDATRMRGVEKMVETFQKDVPELADRVKMIRADEVFKTCGLNDLFVGGVTYKSGAMWPYRLVTSVYASLLAQFSDDFALETGTMVEEIQLANDKSTPFMLKTSRGNIRASHVVHATDAFAANLVPGLVGKVFPIVNHMSAQRPGKAFPNYNGSKSWSFVGKKDFDYVTQRPGLPDSEDGLGAEIMIGGGIFHSDDSALDQVGEWRDDKINHPTASYLSGVLPVSFGPASWGEDADGSRVKQLWSGCMGFTLDVLPLVGPLSPKLTKRHVKPAVTTRETKNNGQLPGSAEWISAGFNGSGMVMTWLSGVATALMILGRENVKSSGDIWKPEGVVEDWLPKEYLCSPERISRGSINELPKYV
ncbi:FAD dependent oxidoreductase-like protein [Cadophora sp. MPI-SDFR-AT-0126]|nr:FAD dependent oxidoreductase-like protein [Leotiomycetes sp. MPI-SDFR-AT-0126]